MGQACSPPSALINPTPLSPAAAPCRGDCLSPRVTAEGLRAWTRGTPDHTAGGGAGLEPRWPGSML